jgi:hypothetical protein
VAALERELDELHRVEEVLVAAAIAAGHSVHRSPSVPPAAGVKTAEALGAKAGLADESRWPRRPAVAR